MSSITMGTKAQDLGWTEVLLRDDERSTFLSSTYQRWYLVPKTSHGVGVGGPIQQANSECARLNYGATEDLITSWGKGEPPVWAAMFRYGQDVPQTLIDLVGAADADDTPVYDHGLYAKLDASLRESAVDYAVDYFYQVGAVSDDLDSDVVKRVVLDGIAAGAFQIVPTVTGMTYRLPVTGPVYSWVMDRL